MKQRLLRLRVARAAHEPKVSQMYVARKAGMGTFRYWQIENGEGPAPSRGEKIAVAAALDLQVGDIDWPTVQVAQQKAATA